MEDGKTKASPAEKKEKTKASPAVGIGGADISPERIKKMRHWTNMAKRPYIAESGFTPEIFSSTVKEMSDEDVLGLFKRIFTTEADSAAAARKRIVTIIEEGR